MSSVVEKVAASNLIRGSCQSNSQSLDLAQTKNEESLVSRNCEAKTIREKFPDRIPVICNRDPRSNIMDIDKTKFLVPFDISLGHFIYIIRKRIKVEPSKSLFIFINNTIPPTAAPMSAIYEQFKSDDGFLYMYYSGENTFG